MPSRNPRSAAAVGADEIHISLKLVHPVPPDQHVELLGTLAAKIGLDRT